jgi:hypothetical protein
LFREARSVAHQRNPDADEIEITTPDVEVATVRVEMKLARLRQLRFPFRLVQSGVSLIAGYLFKVTIDLVNLPQDNPHRSWLPWVGIGFLACLFGMIVIYHFESKAELLR